MRRLVTLVAVGAMSLVGATLAGSPAYAGTETTTIHVRNVTESGPDVNPCSGATGILTQTYSGVFHITKTGNGSKHQTGTLVGSFTFDANDPAEPDYVGKFTVWFGGNGNQQSQNFTETFSIHHAVGTDGSILRAHEVAHVTVNKNGVQVSFDRLGCS
jgi:hypothetical protein